MKRLLPFILLFVFGIITGCDILGSGDDDSLPTLNGPYEIKTTAKLDGWEESSEFTYEIDLSESDKSLSGSGNLMIESKDSPDAATYDLRVTGFHNRPDVRVEMESSDSEYTYTDVFEGTSEDGSDRMEGILTFADGTQQNVIMRSK